MKIDGTIEIKQDDKLIQVLITLDESQCADIIREYESNSDKIPAECLARVKILQQASLVIRPYVANARKEMISIQDIGSEKKLASVPALKSVQK